jgi:uncharacterized lipoprotein YajG
MDATGWRISGQAEWRRAAAAEHDHPHFAFPERRKYVTVYGGFRKMRRRVVLLLFFIGVATSAVARGNLKEFTVPLKFTPQEGVHTSNPDVLPGVLSTSVMLVVEDARKQDDPLVIGQGTGGDDKVFPIHADRPVLEYVREVAGNVAKEWGLRQETPAARNLTIQVTRFYLDESNKALGSVYGTEVKLTYTLKDAGGTTLVSGATSGTAHRYGRAHSVENCNEVLSDALKEAFANVLADGGLQQAWASGQRATGTTSGAPKETAEERLRKLDDLLKKGLITKDEYATKRAEILKDM